MREYLDAAVFKDMILCADAALAENTQQINELNVFPVPDGDTGTNMGLTMNEAAAQLRKKEFYAVDAVADCVAGALLRGARGNSGVILSLLFRGISRRLKGMETVGAKEFAAAMEDGVDAAYKAVMKPAEGTILTVARMSSTPRRARISRNCSIPHSGSATRRWRTPSTRTRFSRRQESSMPAARDISLSSPPCSHACAVRSRLPRRLFRRAL